jgi:hypothetical protein
VKKNQPLLYAQLTALPWRHVPTGATSRDTGHGPTETRTLKTARCKPDSCRIARGSLDSLV